MLFYNNELCREPLKKEGLCKEFRRAVFKLAACDCDSAHLAYAPTGQHVCEVNKKAIIEGLNAFVLMVF